MQQSNITSYIASGAVLLFAAPILFVCSAWLMSGDHQLDYFAQNGLLFDYMVNSLLIAGASVVVSVIFAIPAAWYVTVYQFAGRKWLEWAMILPLAVPSYIAAIVYGHILEGAGPVQYAIRDVFALRYGDYVFPEIRSLGGVVFILSITLYPYVYLLARGAFIMQSQQMLETASLLGCRRSQLFMRLAMPMARPAIVAGGALVIMETLADFGVASLYGIPVFTTGIYRAWLGFYDPIAAGRMASILMFIVLAVLWLEKWQRGKAEFQNATGLYHPMERWGPSSKWHQCLMVTHCTLLVVLGFLLPFGCLLYWSLPHIEHMFTASNVSAVSATLFLALMTSICALCVGLLCAYYMRGERHRLFKGVLSLATIGYALPGSVIAVGVLLTMIVVERWLFAGQMIVSATMLGIIWGCTLRFTTISFQSMKSGLERITPAMDEVAMMLGYRKFQRLRYVHFPLLSSSAIAAFLLVFIDTVKELPATLLLRPFDVNTLSIRVYELAKDEMLPFAAPVALLLVCISIIPVLMLQRKFSISRPGAADHA